MSIGLSVIRKCFLKKTDHSVKSFVDVIKGRFVRLFPVGEGYAKSA